jgi:hypothetical protein
MIFSIFPGVSSPGRSPHRYRRTNTYFQSEADLQEYCLLVLESKGLNPEQEVWVGEGLRADIIARGVVYELKRTLTRESIYQAYGQGRAYVDSGRYQRLVIVGQLPDGEEQQGVARKTARHLERLGKVKVSFVEEDDFWQLDESAFMRRQKWRLVMLAVGVCLVSLTGKEAVLIVIKWFLIASPEQILRGLLSAAIVFFIFYFGFRPRVL